MSDTVPLDLFLGYIYNYPAPKEYFIKLYIFGQEPSGQLSLLQLTSEKDPQSPTGKVSVYCDKVRMGETRMGETLLQAIERVLKDEFELSGLKAIKVTGEFDADYNKKGELLPRSTVYVTVKYQEIKKQQLNNLYLSWRLLDMTSY
jgi:hypothetical protein